MGTTRLFRRAGFMLLGAAISTGIFALLMLYVYHFPEIFGDPLSAIVFNATAMIAALAGLALVEWDAKYRTYLRGLVERLAAAAVAGLVFYLECLLITALLGGLTAMRDPFSIDSVLFFGNFMFLPTFLACGIIRFGRILFSPSRS